MAKSTKKTPAYVTKYWTVITYLDSGDDADYMAYRLEYARCIYAYILHDKDVTEEGLPKKPHIHWCVEFTTPHGEEYVCRLFGANKALPMKRDKQLSYRYLAHLDDKDKYQYPVRDIVTNVRDLSPYLVLESDVPEETEFTLMDAIQAVASNMMTYREFYSRFPSMLYKACVVETLVKQFSKGSTVSAWTGCASEQDAWLTLEDGRKAKRVRENIVQVLQNI